MTYHRLFLVATIALGGATGLAGCNDSTPAGEATPAVENTVEDNMSATAPELSEDASPEVMVADAETIRAKIDDARGTVAVVNFWATWCKPCVAEMPALKAFYEEHAGADLRFISLSGDHKTVLEDTVKPFIAEHALPFDVYVMDWDDPADMAAIAETLDLGWDGVFPTTYVFNREGEVVFSKSEEVTEEQLVEIVAPLLPKAGTES